MRVRVWQRGAPSSSGLVASILLYCAYSLAHLRALSIRFPQGDRRLITLEGAQEQPQWRAQRAAESGGALPLDASLARRDALLAAWPPGRPKAAILVLSRNIDLGGVEYSMEQLERRFNGRAQYPYIFLNDQPHTAAFMAAVANATRTPCLFGQVPREHWSYPPFTDQVPAAAASVSLWLSLCMAAAATCHCRSHLPAPLLLRAKVVPMSSNPPLVGQAIMAEWRLHKQLVP